MCHYLGVKKCSPGEVALPKSLLPRPLDGARTQKNMLDITFYGKSIFVAFHHGMCGGRGIMPFIMTLIYYYLRRVYKLRNLHIPMCALWARKCCTEKRLIP